MADGAPCVPGHASTSSSPCAQAELELALELEGLGSRTPSTACGGDRFGSPTSFPSPLTLTPTLLSTSPPDSPSLGPLPPRAILEAAEFEEAGLFDAFYDQLQDLAPVDVLACPCGCWSGAAPREAQAPGSFPGALCRLPGSARKATIESLCRDVQAQFPSRLPVAAGAPGSQAPLPWCLVVRLDDGSFVPLGTHQTLVALGSCLGSLDSLLLHVVPM